MATVWDDFDVMCQVVAHQGFSAAARALERPKSSLSASVARLEARLGVRLLQRTTRRLRLTDAGAALYEDVAPIFARLREIEAEAMNLGKVVSGRLRIAAPYEFGAHHLAAVACDMMSAHPELTIDIEVEHARIAPLDHRFDLVFSMYDDDTPPANTIARRMFALPRSLFASPSLLGQGRPIETVDDLARMPHIASPSDQCWGYVDEAGQRGELVLNPRMRSSNAEVRRSAALAGLGVARITTSFCLEHVRTGALVPICPGLTWTPLRIYAIFPGQRLIPPKVRMFLDVLEKTSVSTDPGMACGPVAPVGPD